MHFAQQDAANWKAHADRFERQLSTVNKPVSAWAKLENELAEARRERDTANEALSSLRGRVAIAAAHLK
jgi:hypothetical protein